MQTSLAGKAAGRRLERSAYVPRLPLPPPHPDYLAHSARPAFDSIRYLRSVAAGACGRFPTTSAVDAPVIRSPITRSPIPSARPTSLKIRRRARMIGGALVCGGRDIEVRQPSYGSGTSRAGGYPAYAYAVTRSSQTSPSWRRGYGFRRRCVSRLSSWRSSPRRRCTASTAPRERRRYTCPCWVRSHEAIAAIPRVPEADAVPFRQSESRANLALRRADLRRTLRPCFEKFRA